MTSQDLLDRVVSLKNKMTQYEGSKMTIDSSIKRNQGNIVDINERIKKIDVDISILRESIEVLKVLIKQLTSAGLEQYEQLINRALNEIFIGRRYEFKVDVQDRGDKKRVFLLLRKFDSGSWGEWRNIDNSTGGSARAIIDLISRIFLIVIKRKQKFLFLDESLSQVSADYIGRVKDFLRLLAEDMEFDIVFITHDPRYIAGATKLYEIKGGIAHEIDEESISFSVEEENAGNASSTETT